MFVTEVFEIPDVWVEILMLKKKITSMPMTMKVIIMRPKYLPKSVAMTFVTKTLHLFLPTYAGARRHPCILR